MCSSRHVNLFIGTFTYTRCQCCGITSAFLFDLKHAAAVAATATASTIDALVATTNERS